MTLLVVFVASVALVSKCAALLHDEPKTPTEAKPSDPSAWFDALLFLLVLIGTIHHHKSKRDKDDDTTL